MKKVAPKNPRLEITLHPEDFDDFEKVAKGERMTMQDYLRALVRNEIKDKLPRKRTDRSVQ